MENSKCMINFEFIYIVVNDGMGSKVLQRAKKYGIPCGTIFYGKGTVRNKLLQFLSLDDVKKEIVLIGADTNTAKRAIRELSRDFEFEKRNKGIAFSISTLIGIGLCNDAENFEGEKGDNRSMYQVIFTVVNRGMAEEVIEASKGAGSKGGTIINARGSGINDTQRLFHIDIEPEKEMVMILSKSDITNNIVAAISKALDIEKAGNGIIFVQDVSSVYGIYE